MDIRVEPATEERFADVGTAFGKRGAKPDSCWCQRFRRHDEPSNRDALLSELRAADVPIGLLAYAGDRPVGWSRVVPRHTLPGIGENRALQRVLAEDASAWWVTCFAVHPDHRGSGVGVALLRAGVAHARRHGGSVLDGHPVDVGKLTGKASPSALFTGTSAMFVAAGFHEIARTYPSRPVMRMDLRE
jgi:GNAT superfamily N-acetyltransferase